MRTFSKTMLLGAILMLSLSPLAALGQEDAVIKTRNLGGPRFGLTYIPGDGQLSEELEHYDMGRTISQFGSHFEHQVIPADGGPQFVIEFVPMLAGVEYGKLIPNFTLAMGFRTPGGFEFGMGPNLTFSKTIPLDSEGEAIPGSEGDVDARTALLLAVGKSFNYGGVSIPVKLAYTTGPEGQSMSVIFGYAIGKSSKEEPKKIEAEELDAPPKTDWSQP